MKEEIKSRINDAAGRFTAEDASRYGITEEEVKESAMRMKDPEYRKKIHEFAKACLKNAEQ